MTTSKTENIQADYQLPYRRIPDHPIEFTAPNAISRMIDGLGFRYYWSTEGLTTADLAYKPSADSRSSLETLEHLLALSETILNTAQGKPNLRPLPKHAMEFDDMRRKTLESLYAASQVFRNNESASLEKMSVVFKRPSGTYTFPLWNMINGQIADALYHTGQIVAFRRASGNPIDPEVNVFLGKLNR